MKLTSFFKINVLAAAGTLALLGGLPSARAQLLYSADFNNTIGYDHTTSNPPPAGPNSIAGPNWTIGYTATPSTDTTSNTFGTDGSKLTSEDFGGAAFFFTTTIDVSAWNVVDINGQGDQIGSAFTGSEAFQWSYTLDGGSPVNGASLQSGSFDTPSAWTNLDVTGFSNLVVRFDFNVNGAGQGFDIDSLDVTGIPTIWTGDGSGGTWQNSAQGNLQGNYINDLTNTVTFEGTGENITTTATPQAGNLVFSADGYDLQGTVQLGGGNIEVTDAAHTATISADLSGDSGSGFAKSGDGTLVLSGNNTFTGAGTIDSGTLEIQSSNALGTTAGGTTVADGATLALSGGITTAAEGLSINGSGESDGGALRNLSGSNEHAGSVTLSTDSRINSDAGNLSLSGGIVGDGNALSVGGTGDTTVTTTGIAGVGTSLIKDGTGTLTVNAAGTFDGGTSISEGIVRVGNDTGLGSAGVAITDGTLFAGMGVNVNNNITVASPIGAVTIFTETFTNTSGFSVTQGGLGNDGTADYFDITDGTNINQSYTGAVGDFLAGQDIDDGGWTGSASPSQLVWAGIDISNTSDLEFEGLFASNGGGIDPADFILIEFQIDGGGYQNLLAFESNGGSTLNVDFAQDTTFDGEGNGTALTGTFANFIEGISGTGSSLDLRFTVALDSAGEDFAADEFAVTGIGVAAGSGGNVVLGSDISSGTATFSGNISLDEDVNLTAASGGTTEFSGVIADGSNGSSDVTKIGAGTVVLSGNNTYSGLTTVSAGTLEVNTDSLPGNVLNNAALVFNQVLNGTYSGNISGTGSLTKSGAGDLTLTGSSSYSGGTTVSDGELTGSTANLQGNITNNATLEFAQVSDGTYAGVMSGSGDLTKSGLGDLALSGVNTFSGLTTVSGGTLSVDGSLAGGVTVESGSTLEGDGSIAGAVTIGNGGFLGAGNSIGSLTLDGGATLDGGSELVFEFDSIGTGGVDYDQWIGDLNLSGTGSINLRIVGLTGHTINLDDSFTLFTGTVTGDLSRFNIINNSDWVDGWALSEGSLVLTAIPEPGTIMMVLLSFGAMGLVSFLRRR